MVVHAPAVLDMTAIGNQPLAMLLPPLVKTPSDRSTVAALEAAVSRTLMVSPLFIARSSLMPSIPISR